jgi:Reverse transcriptase (RNA-dependent DNA polymerase)
MVLVVAASEALKNPNFKSAMDKESAALKDNNCIEEICLADLEDSCNDFSTRWDFTIKKGMSETRFKARLVARGYDDAEKENISSDSPVASAAAQRLVLVACVERQWIPNSWDFSTTFLQGKCIETKCDIVIAPPDGYADPDIAWRLKRPVFGLFSAPKSWYDSVREVAIASGL